MALAAGCKKAAQESPAAPPPAENSPKSEKALLIGLIPEQNLFKQLDRYKPLAAYLSKHVGVKVDLIVLPRYGNILDNFVSSGMDGAFFGSFTYALAHARLGVEVLARPENLDGSSTYHGFIFVRRDSGIRELRDMRGKRFAMVDKATTAGYLLPMAYFRSGGVRDFSSFLGEVYFTGTHEDAIYDVLNGRADIGAAKNTVYKRVADSDSRIMEQLVIVAKSPDVPENALAVRSDLAEGIKRGLKEALLTMDQTPEGQYVLQQFGAARFIETTDGDYSPVFQYARQAGLDLSRYDYVNR
ncbi:MAG: hypothetical protein Kow0025_07220 [Thermodesulfovibrionales bacterium]